MLPEGTDQLRDSGDGGEAARRVRGRCCGGRARAAAVEPSPSFTKHVSVPVRSVTGHQVEALAYRFAASDIGACGYLARILTIRPRSVSSLYSLSFSTSKLFRRRISRAVAGITKPGRWPRSIPSTDSNGKLWLTRPSHATRWIPPLVTHRRLITKLFIANMNVAMRLIQPTTVADGARSTHQANEASAAISPHATSTIPYASLCLAQKSFLIRTMLCELQRRLPRIRSGSSKGCIASV